MEDPLTGLTDAQQSRTWAAFLKLDHRLRKTKEIGRNECIREAYKVCARELPSELALALLARYGLALRWLLVHRPPVVPAEPSLLELLERAVSRMRGGSLYAKPGWTGSTPSPGPACEPLSEAEWRVVIARVRLVVADLIQGKAPRAAMEQVRYPARAAWLHERLEERNWTKHDLARYDGPDHKTTQKVLDGFAVQDGVFQKIAQGLSRSGAKVSLTDIPQK